MNYTIINSAKELRKLLRAKGYRYYLTSKHIPIMKSRLLSKIAHDYVHGTSYIERVVYRDGLYYTISN